jgi:hypothetical protein
MNRFLKSTPWPVGRGRPVSISALGRFWREAVVRHRDRLVSTVKVGVLLVG